MHAIRGFRHRGTAMPILTVRHLTSYLYRRPVTFGEHRMMLRPRDDDDQKVLEFEFAITPAPSQISWTRDISAIMSRPPVSRSPASELHFECTIRLDHVPAAFRAADIGVALGLIHLPTPRKSCPILPVSWPLYIRIPRWIVGCHVPPGGRIGRHLPASRRHDADHRENLQACRPAREGIQEPARILQCASGSCRS